MQREELKFSMYMTFLLLLLHYVHTISCAVYTVAPDDHYYPNSTCHYCHNLQHYLLNITKYFTSNTRLLFLPGLHHLHTHLIIQNVHNISLIGSTANGTTLDTVIQCNSAVGILMTNVTKLTITDIAIKNCKNDGRISAAVLITECTKVQWRRITVDSINSNGIIGINVLGDSCFSYIKCHMLKITYNDTQLAQNNSNHALLIDHYLITDQSSTQMLLKFIISQHFYSVKITLANINLVSINHTIVSVSVIFTAKHLHQNKVVIRDSKFIHSNVYGNLLNIEVLDRLAMSNNIVQVNTCLFSNNIGNGPIQFTFIKCSGELAAISISDCKFHNNNQLIIFIKENKIPQETFATNIYISNTTFSLNKGAKLFFLDVTKLHLKGPVIFHNNTCAISIITVRISNVSLTNYIEFSANKAQTFIRYVAKTYYFMMLTESTTLNVSYNSFTFKEFAKLNLFVKSPTIPMCYFQYFSNRQLDNYHGNFSITFNDNNVQQNTYNNLHIVHCRWLPQSAYNTALPPVVNQQYIQFINGSHEFNILPQLNRRKILCYCYGDYQECYKEILGPVYPGQTMTVMLKDSRHTQGGNTNDVIVDTSSPTACLINKSSEIKQSINKNNCTELKYSIAFSSDNWCELYLRTSFYDNQHTDIYYITQLPCPTGFIKNKGICQCDSSINEYNIKCDINDQTILRPANSWISATTHNNSYTYHISLHCPFHYCLPHSSHLNFSTPNSQCQFNRSGLLCGHCQQGLSTVFSSPYCHVCSNIYLLLVVPIMVAGFSLVILLFLLNITVREGLINPFILYANIISINNEMYFPNDSRFSPTRIFISLANLDLGIPVCFYNGMDDYARMWLQLVFPSYLIFIAMCLIIASRYFPAVQRFTRRRALSVLATLFLLSYTKILLTVSSIIFSYSTITHLPNKHTKLVWSVDGNVPLLGARFIVLFTACLIIFLILIPFNIVLLFTRRLSRFRFINKFKPLLDTYQGPYKDTFYYWTGLQLVVRVIFFGISTLERNLNLAVGNILLSAIGFFQGYCNPYRVKRKNVNDILLFFNLLGFHTLLFYVKDVSKSIIVNVMITLSAVHLMFIIAYHIVTYVHGGVIRNKTCLPIMGTLRKWISPSTQVQKQTIKLNNLLHCNIPDVTHRYHEYQEPLIALN